MEAEDQHTPQSGWQAEDDGPRRREPPTPEAIAQLVEKLLELLPEDLQKRLTQALHELLEAIRALIDWWLRRLERRQSEPVQVRDIPIL